MSYPDQAPARRPAAVTLAAALLGLMALAAGAYAVAALLALGGGTVDRLRSAAAATGAGRDDVDGVVTLLRVTTILSAVLTVLVGLLLIGLAAGLLAGRRGARVATWVVAGLGLLCGCGALAALVGQRAGPLRTDEQTTAEVLGLLGDAYPSWWIPLNAALSVGQSLGYLVVAVLLALPAANGWFGRSRPTPAPTPPPYGPYPPPQAPPPSR
ncbi:MULTISPECIES: hypothetical protein [unclassified Micromonospora]|uniref:hypothetical protein n=1 Tax=unclassified Micromonospora TaxID=2617518 RepID=UPI002FF2977F